MRTRIKLGASKHKERDSTAQKQVINKETSSLALYKAEDAYANQLICSILKQCFFANWFSEKEYRLVIFRKLLALLPVYPVRILAFPQKPRKPLQSALKHSPTSLHDGSQSILENSLMLNVI